MIYIIIAALISLGVITSEADYHNLSDTEKEYYEEMLTDDNGDIIIDDDLSAL